MEGFSPYLDKVYNPLQAGSIDGTDEYPHDRAIARALSAKHKPNKRVKGDPSLTLFVTHLSPKTDEENLYNAFRQYGKITQHRLVRDIVTGFSKCYAFVEFESEKSLRRAFIDGQKTIIDEKEVLVDYEHGRNLKNWIPRRLGGGFGGKKESGQLRFGGRDRPFRKPLMGESFKRSKDNDHWSGGSDNSKNFSDRSRGERRERDYERSTSRRDRDSRRQEYHRYRSRSPEYDSYRNSRSESSSRR